MLKKNNKRMKLPRKRKKLFKKKNPGYDYWMFCLTTEVMKREFRTNFPEVFERWNDKQSQLIETENNKSNN